MFQKLLTLNKCFSMYHLPNDTSHTTKNARCTLEKSTGYLSLKPQHLTIRTHVEQRLSGQARWGYSALCWWILGGSLAQSGYLGVGSTMYSPV